VHITSIESLLSDEHHNMDNDIMTRATVVGQRH
jgi:hypothetical protein